MCDDTRTRVLNAAGPIFAEKGFHRATVREICRAAGVNVASINYHFGDKERLYIETVKRARQARVAQAPLPSAHPDDPPEERLEAFVHTMLMRMIGIEEPPWQWKLMMREILQPTKAFEEMIDEYFLPEFHMLLDILDELLPPDVPEHTRTQVGLGIIGQCLFYRIAANVIQMMIPAEERARHYSVDELTRHICRFTLAALEQSTTPRTRDEPSEVSVCDESATDELA